MSDRFDVKVTFESVRLRDGKSTMLIPVEEGDVSFLDMLDLQGKLLEVYAERHAETVKRAEEEAKAG